MVEQAEAGTQAGPCMVLITNEGVHSADDWARITLDGVVVAPPSGDREREMEAKMVRRRAFHVLQQCFHQVRGDMSADEIRALGNQATQAIVDAARGSPWEMNFSAPQIREEIAIVVRRNLLTMANMALGTE
jgi:hypothetical protein